MAAQVLSFKLPAPPVAPLADQLPAGRLVELRAARAGAQVTAAVRCLVHAQQKGEPSAWVQPAGGSLFPPDLAESGIDLEALVIVHVPAAAGPFGPVKAAELLMRSGGFGLVVVDLCDAAPRGDLAWQGRLLGMAREHDSRLVLLTTGTARGRFSETRKPNRRPSSAAEPFPSFREPSPLSLGPLVSLCLTPERVRVGRGRFQVEHRVHKDKSGMLAPLAPDLHRGPAGLV